MKYINSRRVLLPLFGFLGLAVAGIALSDAFRTPRCEFEIPCPATLDLDFSPNGEFLAVGTHSQNGPNASTCVFRITDAQSMLQLESKYRPCAWSKDGSIFAVIDAKRETLGLWNTDNWSKSGDLELPTECSLEGLCFDNFGNLYAAVNPPIGFDPAPLHGARVWWNDSPDHPKAFETITTLQNAAAFSISAASVGNDTRLAISSPGGIEVLRISHESRGSRQIERECELSETEPAYLRLTPDGQQLAVLQRSRFSVYQVSAGDLSLRFSQSVAEQSVESCDMLIERQRLDISRDGRVAAYCLGDHTIVVRLDDGAEMLKLRKGVHAIALSPDGTRLAASLVGRRSISFYRIIAK